MRRLRANCQLLWLLDERRLQTEPAEDPFLVYYSPEGITSQLRTATICTAIALIMDAFAFVVRKPILIFSTPVTVACLAVLASASIHWSRRRVPAIRMTRDGIQMKKFSKDVIPWTAVKSANPFESFGKPRQIAVVLDNDRVRDISWSDDLGPISLRLLEVRLPITEYGLTSDALLAELKQRIDTARPSPAPIHPFRIQVRQPAWLIALTLPFVLLPMALAFQRIEDAPLRAKIAAPHYDLKDPRRRTSAEEDIKRFPRDTRVRLVYGRVLTQQGHLADAEKELTAALDDDEAISVLGLPSSRRHNSGPALKDQIKILLATVLAQEGKASAAKEHMNGLCPLVPDGEMPKFIRLGLCHYE